MGREGSGRALLEERIARLTDGQRECLLLVAQMHSSKEIARLLGKSPHTVDERLKKAAAALGVASRFEAARLYVEHMQQSGDGFPAVNAAPQPLIYQEPGVFSGGDRYEQSALFADMASAGIGGSNEFREAQAVYSAQASPDRSGSFSWASLLDGTQVNTMPANVRLAAIALIAVLAIIGVGSLVSIAEGISRLV